MRWAALLLVLLILVSLSGGPGWANGDGEFQLADPAGDDYGPGGYIYPKNRAFEPYHGLFDLLSLAVSSEADTVRLDLTLADLRNPWVAPEGFSHQLIEVYICRQLGYGRTEPLLAGAYVSFSPKYPWEVRLKAAPWDSSELVVIGPDGQPIKHPIQVGLAGRRTVRLSVPASVVGLPTAAWRYYVLIGSYDGFGEDNFRPVMAKPGEWHFGGGRDDAGDPQVLDILAPAHGRYSQERQLGSYDPAKKQLAALMPVGPGFLPGAGGFPWPWVFVLGALLIAVAWWNWYAPADWREKIASAGRKAWNEGKRLARR